MPECKLGLDCKIFRQNSASRNFVFGIPVSWTICTSFKIRNDSLMQVLNECFCVFWIATLTRDFRTFSTNSSFRSSYHYKQTAHYFPRLGTCCHGYWFTYLHRDICGNSRSYLLKAKVVLKRFEQSVNHCLTDQWITMVTEWIKSSPHSISIVDSIFYHDY